MKKPEKDYILKLNKIEEKIKERMKNEWLNKSGIPYYISDPEEKIERNGRKIILIKELKGKRNLNCDLIYNGTGAKYKFKIPEFTRIKKLYIEIEGKIPFNPEKGIVIVRINGNEIERKNWESRYIKNRWEIPSSFIKEENIIEISYFEREDVFKTVYDTNFWLSSIKLEGEI